MREKILVIEDDPKISRLLEIELKFEGFDVFFAYDGKEGLNMAKYGSYDLILLDVMLPKMSGMEVCKRIREGSQVPIIMLTAKDEISDKIVGFDYGADDYMTKPFEPSVLVAKIQGMMRRSYEFVQQKDWIEYKGATLQLASTKVSFNGEEMDLSKNELIVLRVLFEKQGDIATREELMNQLWNSDLFVDDNTLSVTVARLRKQLAEIGLANLITTKKGIGYGMAEEIQ